MILDLPFQGGNASDAFSTTIETIQYIFTVNWNTRENAWFFDLSDASGALIIAGVKITLGAFLGRTAGRRPPLKDGVFIAVDTSGQGLPPTFDDLGTRVKIRFFPIEDWIARSQGA